MLKQNLLQWNNRQEGSLYDQMMRKQQQEKELADAQRQQVVIV